MFDISLRILLVFLPFHTILSIFFREKLGIGMVGYLKEFLIFLMLLSFLRAYIQKRIILTISLVDILLFLYFGVLIVVTLFTTGIEGMIYGGKYDFEFLIAFFLVVHGAPLLSRSVSYYLRLFLISGGVALFLGGLLKWPLTEDLLLYVGYSGNPSAWQFGTSVPIFHGVEGANIRRFQGIFDGPNSAAAFLLLFLGVFLYYMRNKKEWFFVTGIITLGLIGMILYTYSRSALIGLCVATGSLILFHYRTLYRRYSSQFISLIAILTIFVAVFFVQYQGNIRAIFERGGSTQGHLERMLQGVSRIQQYPLGQGLGSAGPAYRYVANLEGADRAEIEALDRYSIPESWFIQQGIEGGVIGGVLFIILMGVLLSLLFRSHPLMGAMFLSILVMNNFLHTFESSFFSLSLFIILGLLLARHNRIKV